MWDIHSSQGAIEDPNPLQGHRNFFPLEIYRLQSLNHGSFFATYLVRVLSLNLLKKQKHSYAPTGPNLKVTFGGACYWLMSDVYFHLEWIEHPRPKLLMHSSSPQHIVYFLFHVVYGIGILLFLFLPKLKLSWIGLSFGTASGCHCVFHT